MNLVKSGIEVLTLTGGNTYTGDTSVQAGTLSITSTLASPITPWLADGADVYLTTGSTLALNFSTAGETGTIRSLFIDGVGQATGTWGGTGSGAAHITSLITGIGWLDVTTATSLPGDYNHDGKVDAGDYVIWRKGGSPTPFSAGDYATWRTNFGSGTPGSGSSLGASAAVPEPASMLLVVMGMAVLSVGRRCRRNAA